MVPPSQEVDVALSSHGEEREEGETSDGEAGPSSGPGSGPGPGPSRYGSSNAPLGAPSSSTGDAEESEKSRRSNASPAQKESLKRPQASSEEGDEYGNGSAHRIKIDRQRLARDQPQETARDSRQAEKERHPQNGGGSEDLRDRHGKAGHDRIRGEERDRIGRLETDRSRDRNRDREHNRDVDDREMRSEHLERSRDRSRDRVRQSQSERNHGYADARDIERETERERNWERERARDRERERDRERDRDRDRNRYRDRDRDRGRDALNYGPASSQSQVRRDSAEEDGRHYRPRSPDLYDRRRDSYRDHGYDYGYDYEYDRARRDSRDQDRARDWYGSSSRGVERDRHRSLKRRESSSPPYESRAPGISSQGRASHLRSPERYRFQQVSPCQDAEADRIANQEQPPKGRSDESTAELTSHKWDIPSPCRCRW